MNNLENTLKKQIEGLMYYSEYEYPLSVFKVDVKDPGELRLFIANKNKSDHNHVKNISSEHFFARFENYLSYNGPDELLNENARQFLDLQNFLLTNFKKMYILRIEKPGDALIPIFIIAEAADGFFAGIETTTVET